MRLTHNWSRDVIFALLALAAIVQIGLGARSLSRSKTWEAIIAARAALNPPPGDDRLNGKS